MPTWVARSMVPRPGAVRSTRWPSWLPFRRLRAARRCTGGLSKRPFTKASIEAFAARSLALPLTLVSDGLSCFTVVQVLADQERV
jgi:hypothetical protein